MLFVLLLLVAHRLELEVDSMSILGFHLSVENIAGHLCLVVCLCILTLSFHFLEGCCGV